METPIENDELPHRDVLCIDVKSFFASVEAVRRRIHPLYAYIIVIANRGRPGSVVLAASPRVKKEFGIKTGSRNFEIPNDPRLMVVEPSMALYLKVNQMVMNIFRRFVTDEDLHIYSIDEAFLDVTASRRLFGDKHTIAKMIQRTIWRELRLVVTIGIGDNPLLAKLALDNEGKNARDGIACWTYEDVPEKVWSIHPITDMWGISSGYARSLCNIGIESVRDLAHADKWKLEKKYGIVGLQMYYHAWGIDYSVLSDKVGPREKSYSKGQILMRDYYHEEEIIIVIKEMTEDVASRLRRHGVAASGIALGISYTQDIEDRGFKHQVLLPRSTNATAELAGHFTSLFKKYWMQQPVRQIHVVCSKIQPAGHEQMDLFTPPELDERRHILDKTIDEIRDRFGKDAIFRAYSLMKGGTYLQRAGHVGGHKGNSN
ncbi:Y-family DNA polymerase [Domibacillus sp. A3M-37]|uniref:Y-family DNA polymerase n=1 Tax=Domibacillus sp. A3M-37 TaxID=2962037 RepID=UPI0020B647CC|nr:Y-family DNA polymerase [Domibacillus sp. A3M-37]MCP3764567.1 Y-family DNA polymerase [Domibacillus sp. A3M-37]